MSKSQFYTATRNKSRASRPEIKDAIAAFMASGTGTYEGDMVIGQHVMNECLERGIPFELTHLGESAVLRRIRA